MSDCSDTPASSVAGSRKRRAPRKSTKYILAQPAPRLATKQRRLVQIRPRLLLQLQRITETRPKPAFDALPSAQVSGPVVMPRLARKFPRLFRIKPALGLDDIILARSEDYDAPESAARDECANDELDHRDVIGVVSPVTTPAMLPHEMTLANGMVQISLEDDNGWFGSPLANGSYQFVRADENGNKTVARWVMKSAARRPTSSTAGSPAPATGTPALPEPRYIFSMIDPTVRRHPILATMTSTNLEVNDQYTAVSPPSSGKYPRTRPISRDLASSPPATDQATPDTPEREFLTLDEPTRNLITATAVWINLRNSFHWPYASACTTPSKRRNSVSASSTNKTAPPVVGSPEIAPVRRSAACTVAEPSTLRTLAFEKNNTSDFAAPPRASTTSTPAAREGTADVGGVPHGAFGIPKRTVSTGAAFMRRRRTATRTETIIGRGTAFEPKASTMPVFDASSDPVSTEIESDDAGDIKMVFAPSETEAAGTKAKGFKGRMRVWKERMSLRIKGL